MTSRQKERIDKLLVDTGLASSRQKAQALIMAGQVIADDKRVDKAGHMVFADTRLRIRGKQTPFVGRGGLKLDHAIERFGIKIKDKVALDVGASTGGFTDCLLQRGIEKVYALDVGYGQMDIKISGDERVILKERTNIRHLSPGDIGEKVDIAVIDVSFISLTKVLPHVIPILKDLAEVVALIKPQFEVGRGEVGKGGIVRDEKRIDLAVKGICGFAQRSGFHVEGTAPSPVLGAKGNREFLVYMKKGPG